MQMFLQFFCHFLSAPPFRRTAEWPNVLPKWKIYSNQLESNVIIIRKMIPTFLYLSNACFPRKFLLHPIDFADWRDMTGSESIPRLIWWSQLLFKILNYLFSILTFNLLIFIEVTQFYRQIYESNHWMRL